MKTLAVTNQKGGVGKTTATLNIGAALASMGRRVLLVDLDSSGDLTYSAGIDLSDNDATIYDVLTDSADVHDAIWTLTDDATGITYDVVPADSALLGLAGALTDIPNPQYRLQKALQTVSSDYDYVLLDTPPLADMASIQALVAADGIVAPTQPHALSVTALSALQRTVNDVHDLNPGLAIIGVLLTNYNGRSTHHQQIREVIDGAMPGKLLDTAISTGVGVTEAAAARTNIFEYAAKTPNRRRMNALQQYRDVANELTERLEGSNDGNSTEEAEES